MSAGLSRVRDEHLDGVVATVGLRGGHMFRWLTDAEREICPACASMWLVCQIIGRYLRRRSAASQDLFG